MSDPHDDLVWSAIAEASRRLVLDLLLREGETTASRLAAQVPFSRQAVSKHLAALEQAGLVRRQRRGREVLYQVYPARVDEASKRMRRLAEEWSRRLQSIKHLAEGARSQADKRRQQRGA
jgi:DNA-binding transcriptional ArsR family regulator